MLRRGVLVAGVHTMRLDRWKAEEFPPLIFSLGEDL